MASGFATWHVVSSEDLSPATASGWRWQEQTEDDSTASVRPVQALLEQCSLQVGLNPVSVWEAAWIVVRSTDSGLNSTTV